jgi:DNA-3-methyladenine glycosylase
MNVVTGEEREGSAVLLRAAEPTDGLDIMAERRGKGDVRLLCSGPGRLTQALGVARAENGLDLTIGEDLFLEPGVPVPEHDVAASTRVGISVAREKPWRFFEAGSPFVSRGPRKPSLARVDP